MTHVRTYKRVIIIIVVVVVVVIVVMDCYLLLSLLRKGRWGQP